MGSKKCSHEGCSRYATYGVTGTGRREFCAQHTKVGMVEFGRKRCAHGEGCSKRPSYGLPGGKRKVCAEHAREGMVDLNIKCLRQGCPKHPSYGIEGSGRRVFCAEHALEGMVNITKKQQCAREGCMKTPSYGVRGSSKRVFCATHAHEGMVNLINRKVPIEDRIRGVDQKSTRVAAAGKRKGSPASPPLRDTLDARQAIVPELPAAVVWPTPGADSARIRIAPKRDPYPAAWDKAGVAIASRDSRGAEQTGGGVGKLASCSTRRI